MFILDKMLQNKANNTKFNKFEVLTHLTTHKDICYVYTKNTCDVYDTPMTSPSYPCN